MLAACRGFVSFGNARFRACFYDIVQPDIRGTKCMDDYFSRREQLLLRIHLFIRLTRAGSLTAIHGILHDMASQFCATLFSWIFLLFFKH
jgi:hypothetical protein